jgi:hypothetical protein
MSVLTMILDDYEPPEAPEGLDPDDCQPAAFSQQYGWLYSCSTNGVTSNISVD